MTAIMRCESGLGYQDEHIYFQEYPEQKSQPITRRLDYMTRAGENILLGSPLSYAWIYFNRVLRSTFDPGSTEYIRFFELYGQKLRVMPYSGPNENQRRKFPSSWESSSWL